MPKHGTENHPLEMSSLKTTVKPDGTKTTIERSISTRDIAIICLFLIVGFVLAAVFMGWVDSAWALELLIGWGNAIAIAVGGWF